MGNETKLRMDAYYYSFTPTGVDAVDRILSAVARAGKGYHHTEDWNEPGRDGTPSYAEQIQRAAEEAARQWPPPSLSAAAFIVGEWTMTQDAPQPNLSVAVQTLEGLESEWRDFAAKLDAAPDKGTHTQRDIYRLRKCADELAAVIATLRQRQDGFE